MLADAAIAFSCLVKNLIGISYSTSTSVPLLAGKQNDEACETSTWTPPRLSLHRLPLDILITLVADFCSAEDVFMLSKTHSAFLPLRESKALWIRILERTRRRKPLPCPDSQGLRELDTSALKRLALFTVRRERNLTCSAPRILGPVRRMQVVDPSVRNAAGAERLPLVHYVTHIHGTSLYIFQSLANRKLLLYDIHRKVLLQTLQMQYQVWSSSLPHRHGELFTFAVGTKLSADANEKGWWGQIRVFTVALTGQGAAVMKEEIQPMSYPDRPDKLYLYQDLVGYVTARRIERCMTFFVGAFNFKTRQSDRWILETDIPNRYIRDEVHCYMEYDGLHILHAWDLIGSFLACRIDRSYFPSEDRKKAHMPYTDWKLYRAHDGRQEGSDAWSLTSMAIPLQVSSVTRDVVGSSVCWTSATLTVVASRRSDSLNLEPSLKGFAQLGSASWSMYHLTCGPTSSAIIVRRDRCSLFYSGVRRGSRGEKLVIRPLEIPGSLGFTYTTEDLQVIWDEHRGVVVFLLPDGSLWTIPYA